MFHERLVLLSKLIIAQSHHTSNKIDFTTLGENYSTTEKDTGFTWVDGKHIYKKTISRTTGSDSGVYFNDALTSDAFIIRGEGVIHNNGYQIGFPFYSSGNDYCRFYVHNKELAILYGDIYKNTATFDITLYYTKTS